MERSVIRGSGFRFASPGLRERHRMAKIGFIGLGNMGLPMAQNLIKAGHPVCGYDVNAAALDKLSAAGGIAVRSLDVASMGVDLVITMLPAREQVREVYLGQGGVLASAK